MIFIFPPFFFFRTFEPSCLTPLNWHFVCSPSLTFSTNHVCFCCFYLLFPKERLLNIRELFLIVYYFDWIYMDWRFNLLFVICLSVLFFYFENSQFAKILVILKNLFPFFLSWTSFSCTCNIMYCIVLIFTFQ